MNPVWSPDSKWIAYSRLLNNLYKAIFLYNVETGQSQQITDGLADAITPVWDAGGKYLYFLASTDYGLTSSWLDMSAYSNQVNCPKKTPRHFCQKVMKKRPNPRPSPTRPPIKTPEWL
jgi:tricorn protease